MWGWPLDGFAMQQWQQSCSGNNKNNIPHPTINHHTYSIHACIVFLFCCFVEVVLLLCCLLNNLYKAIRFNNSTLAVVFVFCCCCCCRALRSACLMKMVSAVCSIHSFGWAVVVLVMVVLFGWWLKTELRVLHTHLWLAYLAERCSLQLSVQIEFSLWMFVIHLTARNCKFLFTVGGLSPIERKLIKQRNMPPTPEVEV